MPVVPDLFLLFSQSSCAEANTAGTVGEFALAPPTRVLDRTGAFDVALSICSGVIFLGALSYLFVVKDPVRDAD
jgi:hypothetical protein